MPPVVIAVATAVSAAAADTAAVLGASSAIIEGVSTLAYSLAITGITTGIATGIGAAFAPKVPDPQALQTPLKQPMPVRQSAFGRVRVGGAYAYFGTGVGTAKALSIDIYAMLDGRSQGLVAVYLNDDLMAPVGDYWWAPGAPGKYGGGGTRTPNLVQIDYRLGLPTETSYSEIEPALPLWGIDHRGDGVTSLAVLCTPARREDQSGDFPNGDPAASGVFDTQLVYDPRDGGQTQGDESTYVYSDNPILCLLAYLTDANGGMGLDYARFILPAVDDWTAAADECDGLVSTSGMHATLLDAAAVGDNKIFLADTTGLAVGATVQLATENVTVSALGLAGEVDLTGDMLYAHAAGELAAWPGFGQQAAYRCAGTYSHATPPGDVVKSILSTFDGWLGQRGDGALVPRTNTLYAPTVTLGDRHIVGYVLNNYLPDEQATNQYIVSYTDPAAAFNKAEAGYVQDDIDIAARGQPRSQELYLQWAPSGPQAVSVARAMLARATQRLRGTLTCNLAGLAVMGERYIALDVVDPALAAANGIVEVTGKVSIDLASMTVSFPWVSVGNAMLLGSTAICFAIDVSYGALHPENLAHVQSALSSILSIVAANLGGAATFDICAIGWGYDANVTTNITRRGVSAADLADVDAFIQALTLGDESTDPRDALNAAKTFFDATDPGIPRKALFVLTDGDIKPTPAAAVAAAAGVIAATMADVEIYAMRLPEPTSVTPDEVTYMEMYDNTPGDGVPTFTDASSLVQRIEQALFGSTSTVGSSYTLPTLAPPSGSALQPLDIPAIISVTPDYSDSGGGVSGARLSIEVDDPGLTATWKLRWKLSADTLWTVDGGPLDAEGSPLTLLSGFVAATGSIDVQVAYVTAAQVSPWSVTSSVTVAAPVVATTTLTASETITAPALVNIWNSAGAKVRNANASAAGKEAHGFVLTSIASGASGTIYTAGEVTGLSSLTPGEQYLAASAGAVTATAPTSTGQIVQRVGFAHSSTVMTFEPGDPVIRR